MAGHRIDHRMRRRHFLERGKLALGARVILLPQQRRDEAVMRGDLAVVLVLGQRLVEERDRFLRFALVAAQQRAHEVKVE